MKTVRLIAIICGCFLISLRIQDSSGLFRLNRIECKSLNQSLIIVDECKLKLLSRNASIMTLRFKMIKSNFKELTIKLELLRKYGLHYRIFFVDCVIDYCEFVHNPRRYVIGYIIYRLYKDYTNFNHSCSHYDYIIFKDVVLYHKNLEYPLPTGDYILRGYWSLDKQLALRLNFWFTFATNDGYMDGF